jgi:nucleolar protein TMA23
MNASALLSAQGWRGSGHSLHATDDSVGLAKPLLLSRKDNTLGLGNKQHFTSDQWWMSAFDEQLKGLDTSKEGKVVQTITNGRLNSIEKFPGKYALYASFVRGGMLEGTIDNSESSEPTTPDPLSTQHSPNRSAQHNLISESKEERRARRAARRQRKMERKAKRERKVDVDQEQQDGGVKRNRRQERKLRELGPKLDG